MEVVVKVKKEIVLLGKSWKNGGYCVGGIDVHSGKWIRIVTASEPGSPGITDNQMMCGDGHLPKALDRVRVPLAHHAPFGFHYENWLMDSGTWEYIGTEPKEEFLAQIESTTHSPIFYTRESTVDPEIVKGVPPSERYSIALVRPDEIRIRSEPNGLRKKYKASFTMDRINYLNLCITDPDIHQWMGQKDSFILSKPTLLMSLSEPFLPKGGLALLQYKLVARVF